MHTSEVCLLEMERKLENYTTVFKELYKYILIVCKQDTALYNDNNNIINTITLRDSLFSLLIHTLLNVATNMGVGNNLKLELLVLLRLLRIDILLSLPLVLKQTKQLLHNLKPLKS